MNAKHHKPDKRRTGHRRALLTAAIGILTVVSGLVVGGALAARDADLASEGISNNDPAPSSTTATGPPTTTSSTTTTTIPPTTTTTTTTTTAPPAPAADGNLELGESGEEVAALQTRLGDLGYWIGAPDGSFGQLTRQAVMAFQKAQGLGRDGVAGPATVAALQSAGRPAPREPSGSHLEIDLDRQILLVVQDGKTQWVLNTSTGSNEAYATPGGGPAVARTPPGRFAIQREIDGLREAPLGTLYRPKYFNGGIAIHGSGSIPARPASHGCARVTSSAMDLLWSSGVARLGTGVLVY